MPEQDNIVIEDARLIFRNFAGKETRFNPAGKRNFGVLLGLEDATRLKQAGWNVKTLNPKNEGDDPQPWLPVSVAYGFYPPKVTLISSTGKVTLDEETVGQLDWAEIRSSDVVIRPYNWEMNGTHGVKAYLKSIWVTIQEDPFAQKYSDTSEEPQDIPF